MTRHRRREEKICTNCSKPFMSLQGNLRCWKCINAARRKPCLDCGVPCGGIKRAKRCQRCDARRTERRKKRPGDLVPHASGYVNIYMPDHPRRSKSNYVLHHIVVMEQTIGRYLVFGETVHHKNGVRSDNRPSNLELWARPQPSGARAIDLLAWARTVVTTYEPIESILSATEETRTPNLTVDSGVL